MLLTATTHAAVDVLAAKLLEKGIQVIRVGSNEDRIGASLDEGELKSELLLHWEERESLLRGHLENGSGFVLLGTATGYKDWVFRKVMQDRDPIKWDKVIIDEAGKMAKPETLVAIKNLKPEGQLILAGDPKQLPPYKIGNDRLVDLKRIVGRIYEGIPMETIFSPDPEYLSYQTSFLEHAVKDGKIPIYHLRRGRRAKPIHVGLAQAAVYGKKLEPRDTGRDVQEPTEKEDLEVIAYNQGEKRKVYYERHLEQGGVYNDLEAALGVERFFKFYNLPDDEKENEYQYQLKDIRFISPYRAQLSLFDDFLLLTSLYFEFKLGGASLKVLPQQWEHVIYTIGVNERIPENGEEAAKIIEKRLQLIPSPLYSVLLRIDQARKGSTGKGFSWRFPSFSTLHNIALSVDLSGGNGSNGNENRSIKRETTSTTVHRAQGGEWPVVIFSLVRSNPYGNLGFLGSKDGPSFITVGITRQMERLVVLVDADTFRNARRGRFAKWQAPFVHSVMNQVATMIDFYQAWRKRGYAESWRTWFGGKRKELLHPSPHEEHPFAIAA